MKNTFTRWISGASFIVLGLLIAVGPHTIFKACDGTMKCHWTAQAEIGIGGAIALLGVLLLLLRKSQVRLGLSLAQAALGITAILITTRLIGVCPMKSMQCNQLMYPMLLVLSGFVIVVSLVNVFFLRKES